MTTHPHAPDDARPLTVEVDGLAAHRDGDRWLVAPTRGDLAHDASGLPALTLVAAGPLTFLSLTAELPQPAGAVAALTDAITRATGEAAPQLVPADLGSGTTELVLDGATIARGTTSGSGAHTSALATTLTAEQADAVRAALAGARERLVVRFTLTGGAGSGASSSQSSTSSLSSTTSTTTTSTTGRGDGLPATTTDSTTTHVASGTTCEDVPTPVPPTDVHLATDAADWRVPA